MKKKKGAEKKAKKKTPAHDHAHGHDHAHDHSHAHAHGHAHDHAHDHDHHHAHAHDHHHAHGHDHDHAHGHAHDHAVAGGSRFHAHGDRAEPAGEVRHPHGPLPDTGHGAAHSHDGAPRPPLLAEGEGRGKILFFDAFSGLAGDMIIAALLDLGVPLLVIERALAALPLEGFHLHRGHAHKSAIVATSFDVHLEAPQPMRDYAQIDAMLLAAPLDEPVRDLARRVFRTLGESEAAVHRMPLAEVHFHEVGAVDAIVDIVGASAALVYLGADVVCSPLPMGRGFVRAAHGILPLPPPAVVHCLAGCPTYGVDLDEELVTPTGAAIVATVAKSFARWPTMRPERAGFGAGTKDFPDRPNLLRAVLGAPGELGGDASPGTHVVIEANVDDMGGELAAHAIASLLAAGALDAWVSPVTMKKGRPGLVVAALAETGAAERVEAAMLVETTTIGVRRTAVSRTERPRRTERVETPYGSVRVKISEGPFGPAQIKPEYDDCAARAAEAGVPLREVIRAALAAVPR